MMITDDTIYIHICVCLFVLLYFVIARIYTGPFKFELIFSTWIGILRCNKTLCNSAIVCRTKNKCARFICIINVQLRGYI